MRVLQLIDSLRPGGAERMSVNYANALAKRIDGSFLCCTRKEGLLKSQLSPEVGYLFLNKKSTLDVGAFSKLRNFVKENKIDLIQAHSSSWFLGVLVKLSLPEVKLVWHDHYGRGLKERTSGGLNPASRLFNGIISVNRELEAWSKKHLKTKNVIFIPNFFSDSIETNLGVSSSPLLGEQSNFKIVSLANLRPQKDHINLLKAFKLLLDEEKSVSLHFIGKDFNDIYSTRLRQFISKNNLGNKVFLYGEQENVKLFLEHADMGILSSISEGLPMALLEYGLAGLPVVCTNVGECPAVIGNNGILVPPHTPEALAEAISNYRENEELLRKHGEGFQVGVQSQFSEAVVLPQVLRFFDRINPLHEKV